MSARSALRSVIPTPRALVAAKARHRHHVDDGVTRLGNMPGSSNFPCLIQQHRRIQVARRVECRLHGAHGGDIGVGA